MTAFFTVDDFTTRYGSTIPETDEERLSALIDDACALMESEAGTTYEAGDAPQVWIGVAFTVVRRAYENPLGLRGETKGNYSWQGAGTGQGIYLTPAEKQTILRANGASGAHSVELSADLRYVADADQYVAADSGADILYFHEDELL